MPQYIRSVLTVPHSTGLPEDSIVMTHSWLGEAATSRDTVATQAKGLLDTFYGAVKQFLSGQYLWNSNVLEFIDMADGKPRLPYKTDVVAFGVLSTVDADLPPEVAVCCSYKATTASGENARRRRGRFYLGPLQFQAGDAPAIGTAAVNTIATALAGLKGASTTHLAVYSPYTHHGVPVGGKIEDYPDEIPSLLDDAFAQATTVWVDNAWDIQRRRGTKSTYRKTL